MRLRALVVVAALLAMGFGETPPTITSLDVSSGPRRTLVMITGNNLDDAAIVWRKAGTTIEAIVPAGFPNPNALMFSVPPTVTAGAYTVSVRNKAGESGTLPFTVTAPVAFPRPRIDSVTLVGATFDVPNKKVTATLYVQGANFDVGAVVLIGGSEVATYSHKWLRNDTFDVPGSEFGNRISHFVASVAVAGTRVLGESLDIQVRNLDMDLSDVWKYQLPSSENEMDSDGDSLPDEWENHGHTGIDLKAFGATPYRRDIFVQLDVMPVQSETQPGLQHALDPAALAGVREMFDRAPLLNPTGPPGINLILDTSGSVPYWPLVCFDVGTASDCQDSPMLGIIKYSSLKKGGTPPHFDKDHRNGIFHYGIWGARAVGGDPGQSDFGSDDPAQRHRGDDFLITFDDWGNSSHPDFTYSVQSQLEELAHELGHDLGLHHGGGDDDDHMYLPNHWSVMSYTWEKRSGRPDAWRQQHATCAPFYYRQAGAAEMPGLTLPMTAGTDYSSGMGKMHKKTASSTTTLTICDEAVDWGNDLNTDGTMKDEPDWRILLFDGPQTHGALK